MVLKNIFLIPIIFNLIIVGNGFMGWMEIERSRVLVPYRIRCTIQKVYEPVLFGYNRIDPEKDDGYHYWLIDKRSAELNCFTWAVRYKTSKSMTSGDRTSIVLCDNKKWYNDSTTIVFEPNRAKIYRTYNRNITKFQHESYISNGILKTDVFRTYWISWRNGYYLIGAEGDSSFISWHDPKPFKVNYIGLKSEPYGGEYIIRSPKCGHTSYLNVVFMLC